MDAVVGVSFVSAFVVASLGASEVIADGVVMTLPGLKVMFCLAVVSSTREVSGEESASLVTLPATLLPVGVAEVGTVAGFAILLPSDVSSASVEL